MGKEQATTDDPFRNDGGCDTGSGADGDGGLLEEFGGSELVDAGEEGVDVAETRAVF